MSADFVSKLSDEVIIVHDRNTGSMSVTNDAESVVSELYCRHGNYPIIYRDSEGVYDQLLHVDGLFQGFKILGERIESVAIYRVKIGV